VVSANSNGLSGGCSNGTDANAYSVPISTSVPNAVAYAAIGLRNTAHTPGNGFVERTEIHSGGSGGTAAGLAVVDQTLPAAGSLNASGTFASNLDWAAVAVEIQPAGLSKSLGVRRVAAATKTATPAGVPHRVMLESAPNPFNPRTTIHFGLPEARSVRLSIYDLAGRRVRVVLDEPRGAGMHEVVWAGVDASNRQVSSGIYFAVLEAGETRRTLKLLLAK
jgi:hypothetical protein